MEDMQCGIGLYKRTYPDFPYNLDVFPTGDLIKYLNLELDDRLAVLPTENGRKVALIKMSEGRLVRPGNSSGRGSPFRVTQLWRRQGLIPDALRSKRLCPVSLVGNGTPLVHIGHLFPKRRRLPAGLRAAVLKRDNFQCVACGRNPKDHGVILHVDHIDSVARSGVDIPEIEELQTLCEDCNLGKGTQEDWYDRRTA